MHVHIFMVFRVWYHQYPIDPVESRPIFLGMSQQHLIYDQCISRGITMLKMTIECPDPINYWNCQSICDKHWTITNNHLICQLKEFNRVESTVSLWVYENHFIVNEPGLEVLPYLSNIILVDHHSVSNLTQTNLSLSITNTGMTSELIHTQQVL